MIFSSFSYFGGASWSPEKSYHPLSRSELEAQSRFVRIKRSGACCYYYWSEELTVAVLGFPRPGSYEDSRHQVDFHTAGSLSFPSAWNSLTAPEHIWSSCSQWIRCHWLGDILRWLNNSYFVFHLRLPLDLVQGCRVSRTPRESISVAVLTTRPMDFSNPSTIDSCPPACMFPSRWGSLQYGFHRAVISPNGNGSLWPYR